MCARTFSITYPACKGHETYCLCGVSGFAKFFRRYIINGTIFGGKVIET
jgi:hypothetical protein